MATHFLLLQLCFLVSGFAALLYETAWTRELAAVFGTSELAVSAVLAAYMGGLALGAAVIARWAPVLRRPILAYGLIELGIALGALWVPTAIRLLSGVYVTWLGGLDAPPAQLGLVTSLFHLVGTFLVLLPCTTLMGATLPLLARYAVKREDEIGPRIGLLYGVNTGGAILGALAAAFYLLPEFGLRQTIYFGAATNLLVFVAAAWLSRISAADEFREEPAQREPPTLTRSNAWILPMIAISGAVSFAYEILWVRILGFIFGGSTAAFASMLASFLLGIALGSAAASRLARTKERAALGFALAQLCTAFFAAITFGLADWIPRLAQDLGAGISNLAPATGISVGVLLPTTLCIGATFPFAVRILARSAHDAATATARVYAWNTLGCIFGSVAAGFFLLPLLGFGGTLALGVLVNLGLAACSCLFLPRSGISTRLAAMAAIAGAVFVYFRPDPPMDWLARSALTGKNFEGNLEYLGVGRSATVTLSRTPYARRLATNGLPEASIEGPGAPPDKFHEARWLALLPVLARPDTSRILVIGLGGGNTLGAVPESVQEIELIELEEEVVAANRIVGADRMGGAPLQDPRLTLRIGDARGALMLSDRHYDAIVSQPSHPWTSGASHLYTREFFGLVENRLEDDGVFVQWMGLGFVDGALLRSLVATLADVFEHLAVVSPSVGLGSGSLLFIASNAPLPLLESAAAGLAVAPSEFARVGVYTVEDIAVTMILDSEAARDISSDSPLISDDHNLLAWAAVQTRRNTEMRRTASIALATGDTLTALARELDSDRLIRRLLERGALGRAKHLAESLKGARRESAEGWVAFHERQVGMAIRHFNRALELDPDHRGAELGRALVQPGQIDAAAFESRVGAIVEGRAFRRAGQSGKLQDLDEDLALWPPGSLLFSEATQLRIAWRIEEKDSDLGLEALDLADILVARDRDPANILLRAAAAERAGLDGHAWASLDRLRTRLGASDRSRTLAGRALRLSEQLKPLDGARETRMGIQDIARGRRVPK